MADKPALPAQFTPRFRTDIYPFIHPSKFRGSLQDKVAIITGRRLMPTTPFCHAVLSCSPNVSMATTLTVFLGKAPRVLSARPWPSHLPWQGQNWC